ncbi:flagellar biosynthetic protein FliR [Spartinivicinus ruber]|uniref:flagellar biosynthetic protein FliR n=1 Tax=Spartinivicinus ruber TaxID=2683272 RepID=UPI001CA3C7FE|nr:flagellar biosynthetic protein FliR [Spartinivicinus ruber]
MSVVIDQAWLASLLMSTIRFSLAFWALFSVGVIKLPAKIKLLLIFGLVIVINGQLPVGGEITVTQLVAGMVNELVNGILLSVGIVVIYGAVLIAGRIVDLQAGFNAAGVFDPTRGGQGAVASVWFNLLLLMVLFSTNSHLVILRLIADSFVTIPIGQSVLGSFGTLFKQLPALFFYGVLLSLPVIACLFILDFCLGVVGKTMPQLNVYFFALPLGSFGTLFKHYLPCSFMEYYFHYLS